MEEIEIAGTTMGNTDSGIKRQRIG